jgi:hypothetical protein
VCGIWVAAGACAHVNVSAERCHSMDTWQHGNVRLEVFDWDALQSCDKLRKPPHPLTRSSQ